MEKPILQALPFIARGRALKAGITVTFGGNQASTDCVSKINLPTLPLEDEEVAVLALGYVDHEVGHIRETTPGLKATIDSELQRGIYQPIEDVRMERLHSLRFPGAKKNLETLVGKLVKDGGFAPPDPDEPPAQAVQRYLLYRLRHEILGQPIGEYAEKAEEIIREKMPGGAKVRLDALLGEVSRLKDTAGSVELSGQILAMLQDESENPTPPPPPESGDGGTDSSEPGEQQPGNGSGPSVEQGKQFLKDALAASADDVLPDIGEIAGQALSEQAPKAAAREGRAVAGYGYANEASGSGDASLFIQQARKATNALRQRLSLYLQGERRRRTRLGPEGARLDDEAATRVVFGDADIFTEEVRGRTTDAAVYVLLDASGSMASRLPVAQQACIALGLSLQATRDVSLAIAAFPGRGAPTTVLMKFGERAQVAASRIVGTTASGGTPLAQALMNAFSELALRPESRKLVMVVTDGDPSQPDLCKELVGRASRSGVEIIGIGINAPATANIIPQSINIEHVDELPGRMFQMLQQGLRRARAA